MADSNEEKNKVYPEDSIMRGLITDDYINRIGKVYDKFYRWRFSMTNEWKQLQGYNLVNYIKSARAKMYGFEPISSEDNLNQRPVFLTHEYRTQAEQILMQIANLAQNPRFSSPEGLNFQIMEILNALERHATRGVKYKMNNLLDYWHTIMDGTIVKYISYAPHRKKVKNVKSVDLTTGHITYVTEEIKEGEVEEVLCDITSLYIPKIFEPDMQKQGAACWVQDMTWTQFQEGFKDYPNASAVVPGNVLMTDSIFARMLDKSVLAGDKVQVVKMFDAIEDEYYLIANGIWINPIKGSKDEPSPLPWNHKMLPFAKTQYRFTDANFFYGPALPHLVKSPIEAVEELAEMRLDRVFRSLNPPMLTNEPTIPENFKLESGAIYHTNVNPRTEWTEVQLAPPDPSSTEMSMELGQLAGRIAMPSQPVPTGGKQPDSAAAKLQAAQQAGMSFGFQKMFFQYLCEQKAILTVENMLQFYTSIDMERSVGGKKYLNTLVVENVPLKKGIATLEMRFVKNKQSLSPKSVLDNQKLFHAVFNHENREIIEISADILRNLNFEVEITFDAEETPIVRKAMFNEFLQFMMNYFPHNLDQNKVMFRAFEMNDENPADWIPDDTAMNFPAYLAGIPIQQPNQGGAPGTQLPGMPPGMGGGGMGMQPGGGGMMPPGMSGIGQRVKQATVRGPQSGRGNTKFGQKGGLNIADMLQK